MKLVAEAGIGTVACGVAKAKADIIQVFFSNFERLDIVRYQVVIYIYTEISRIFFVKELFEIAIR